MCVFFTSYKSGSFSISSRESITVFVASWYYIIWMYHNLFNQFPIDEYLGWLPFLFLQALLMNNLTQASIHMHVSVTRE